MGSSTSKQEPEWFDEEEYHRTWQRRVSIMGERRRSSITGNLDELFAEKAAEEQQDVAVGPSTSIVLFRERVEDPPSKAQPIKQKASSTAASATSEQDRGKQQSETMKKRRESLTRISKEKKKAVQLVEPQALKKELAKNDDLRELRLEDFRLHEVLFENALRIQRLRKEIETARLEDEAGNEAMATQDGKKGPIGVDGTATKSKLESLKEQVLEARERVKEKKMELQSLKEVKASSEAQLMEEKRQLEKRIEEVHVEMLPYKQRRLDRHLQGIDKEKKRAIAQKEAKAIEDSHEFLKRVEDADKLRYE